MDKSTSEGLRQCVLPEAATVLPSRETQLSLREDGHLVIHTVHIDALIGEE